MAFKLGNDNNGGDPENSQAGFDRVRMGGGSGQVDEVGTDQGYRGTLGTAGHNSDTFEKKNRLDRIAYGKISLLVADGKNKS